MNVIRCAVHRSGSKICFNLQGLPKNDLIAHSEKYIACNLYSNVAEAPRKIAPTLDEKDEISPKKRFDISTGPGLGDFISSGSKIPENIIAESVPYLPKIDGGDQKVFIDVYGCQMNVNDAEVVQSILQKNGYLSTKELLAADIILLVTCAIRENAEQKVWNRLKYLRHFKTAHKARLSKVPVKIGLLGCMAERLKHKIIEEEKIVDIVAGPDSYKDLPRLLSIADSQETAINVALSLDETYADVTPVRLDLESKHAFVSIMRGCDNMCTYCIVPFTRGRERSRPATSILDEIRHLSNEGIKEVTLLGQNVNSYRDTSTLDFCMTENSETKLAKGFKTVYKKKKGGLRFSDLLDKVSIIDPEMRIRFTSPHPKDFPDEVLHLIAERPNICEQLHMPAQSGNSAVLERMRRGYTRESYLELVQHIREILPSVSLSSDFIAGFCDETEEEFDDTLSLIETVKYNKAFMFYYSMREKTTAHRRYKDNVPEEVKKDRVSRMLKLYYSGAEKSNKEQIGQTQLVLVEKISRKSEQHFQGRTDGGTRMIFPDVPIPKSENASEVVKIKPGDYVVAKVNSATSETFRGDPLYLSSISNYFSRTRQIAQSCTN